MGAIAIAVLVSISLSSWGSAQAQRPIRQDPLPAPTISDTARLLAIDSATFQGNTCGSDSNGSIILFTRPPIATEMGDGIVTDKLMCNGSQWQITDSSHYCLATRAVQPSPC